MIRKAIEKNNNTSIKRDMPLHVLGIGNKRSAPTTHYASVQLIGNRGERINTRFDLFNTKMIFALPRLFEYILNFSTHV